MAQRLWILNIVLAVVLVFFVFKTARVWSNFDSVPGKTSADKTGLQTYPDRIDNIVNAPASEFEPVVADNIFSSKRAEFIPEATEEETEETEEIDEAAVKDAERDLKKIYLYGIIIMDDYRAAMLTNPDRQSGDPEYVAASPGDTIGGYTISQIEEKRVLFDKKGGTYEKKLYDREKPKREIVKNKDSGVNVVSSGKKVEVKNAGAGASGTSKDRSSKQAGQSADKNGDSKDGKDEKKVEWIDTPFGKIKRVIK